MPTATPTVVLGKALAAGIILTPLVMMLFPELNHRSGNRASGGTQAATAILAVNAGQEPVPRDESLPQFFLEGDE
jgi:hypothetical protein